jgi:hypothetical protein
MDNKQYVPQIKVRTALRAGEGGGYVNGVWYPDMSGACGTSTTPPPTTPPTPTPPTSGGGYVNGVWYPDQSGTCA